MAKITHVELRSGGLNPGRKAVRTPPLKAEHELHACGPAHRHLMSAPGNGFPVRDGSEPRVAYGRDFIERHPDRLHEFR